MTDEGILELFEEYDSIKAQLLYLGFCPDDRESMPCLTCGAGL